MLGTSEGSLIVLISPGGLRESEIRSGLLNCFREAGALSR